MKQKQKVEIGNIDREWMERKLKVEIENVGKEWMEVRAFGDNWSKTAKLLITDATRAFSVGEVIEGTFEVTEMIFEDLNWRLEYIEEEIITLREQAREQAQREKKQKELEELIQKDGIPRDHSYLTKEFSRVIDWVKDIKSQVEKTGTLNWEIQQRLQEKIDELDLINQTFKKEEQVDLSELNILFCEALQARDPRKNEISVFETANPRHQIGGLFERMGSVYRIIKIKEFFDDDYEETRYFITGDRSKVSTEEEREYREKLERHKRELEQAAEIDDAKQRINREVWKIQNAMHSETVHTGKDSLFRLMNDAEVLFNNLNDYGSGSIILIKDGALWNIENNGMDGGDWTRNTISTGGAGAWAIYAPAEKYSTFIQELREANNHLKSLEENFSNESGAPKKNEREDEWER